MRAVDTIDGQLFIDWIFKVEGEDGLRANIYQSFHWSTNLVPNMEMGKRTSSHATDVVKIFPESTKIQVQTRQSSRRKCNLRLTPHHDSQGSRRRSLTWIRTVLDSECAVDGDVGVGSVICGRNFDLSTTVIIGVGHP